MKRRLCCRILCNVSQRPSQSYKYEEQMKKCNIKKIQWLKQVHSDHIVAAPQSETPIADACWTREAQVACAVRTADCLPIFLCNDSATQVALIHGGWRGLAKRIISKTLASFPSSDKVYAGFGPAISASHYEVGRDVYEAFTDKVGFTAINKSKWTAELYAIAANQLEKEGVLCGAKPHWCTYSQADLFYSYRRDKEGVASYGRIANLIWLK